MSKKINKPKTEDMTIVEVNGQKYKLIEHKTGLNTSKMKFLVMASMLSDTNLLPNRPQITPEFVKEFELIEQKKSNLSKAKRDYIVKIFNNSFQIYTDKQMKKDQKRLEQAKEFLTSRNL